MGSFLNIDAVLKGMNDATKTTSKQDDDSAVTEVTGGKTKQKDAEMKQMCCQLVLNGNNGGLLKDAALNVATLFKIILADFLGQVSVFDHNGKEHTSIDEKTWKSNIEFQQSFQIDTKSWGAPNNRKEEKVISFNIKSSVSLNTIKHGSRVFEMLSSNAMFLRHNPFNDIKINNYRPIGHFNQMNPSITAEQGKDMLGQICAAKGKNKEFKRLEMHFVMRIASPFISASGGQKGKSLSTTAWQAVATRDKAAEVDDFFKKTFGESFMYVPSKMKYKNAEGYKASQLVQIQFLSSRATIPIIGISRDEMFYIQDHLQARNDVKGVFESWKYPTEGKWNIQTTRDAADDLTSYVEKNLANWYAGVAQDAKDNRPKEFPAPKVVLEALNNDDSSGEDSYCSAAAKSWCTQMSSLTIEYREQLEQQVSTPRGSTPTSYRGALIGPKYDQVTASETTRLVPQVVTTTPSSMTSDVTAQAIVDLTASFTKQMEKMADENRLLKQQLQQLMQTPIPPPVQPMPPSQQPATLNPDFMGQMRQMILGIIAESTVVPQAPANQVAPTTPPRQSRTQGELDDEMIEVTASQKRIQDEIAEVAEEASSKSHGAQRSKRLDSKLTPQKLFNKGESDFQEGR